MIELVSARLHPVSRSHATLFKSRERLGRARAFIDACYDRPLDLDEIARQANFSRYHLIRLFRKTYKRTPHQYLVQKRIEKARELLASSSLTVTEVCFAVGFQSLGSFSALFHKATGQPPTEYRALITDRRQSPHKYIPGCFLKMSGVTGHPSS